MTRDQEAAFLGELGVTGNVAFACRAAGVTRAEALAHRDARPVFERLWRRMMTRASDAAAARSRRVRPRCVSCYLETAMEEVPV